MKSGRLATALAFCAVAVYFLVFAGPGLRAGISGDDLMNTHKSWVPPVSEHLRDTVLFWRYSDSFRPVGSLFYRAIFDRWGLDPLPFRIACYALMLANLWLAYAVLRRVAGSRLTGGLAVLLFAYHGEYWNVLTNTGMVYDLLCFFFWMGAFLYYLRAREGGLPLGWGRVAIWAALYILAMNSKEMAVSLPVVILAYELLASPPRWRRPLAWLWREGRVPIVGAVLTALFVAGRVLSPQGLTGIGPYHPEITLPVYLDRARRLVELMLYNADWLSVPAAFALMGLVAAAAIVWRSVPFRLGVVWAAVGILPIAFIFPRGLDSAYVALPGVALALGTAAAAGARRLRIPPAAAFAGLLAALAAVHGAYGRVDFARRTVESRRNAALHQALKKLLHGRSVLFVKDAFPNDLWDSTFLVQLTARNRDFRVVRADRVQDQTAPDETLTFDTVLSFENGRVVECDAAPFRAVRPGEIASRAAAARCATLTGDDHHTTELPRGRDQRAGDPAGSGTPPQHPVRDR